MNTRFLGRWLKNVHAGEKHLAWSDVMKGAEHSAAPAIIAVTSPAFVHGATLPMRYAGKGIGANISPPLEWTGVAAGAVETVLIVEDTGAPTPRPIVHCIAFGIAPTTTSIGEGRLSTGPAGDSTSGGEIALGKNTMGHTEYDGPRPIPGHGEHTYVFQVFALSRRLSFSPNTPAPKRNDVLEQMRGAVIARGRLDGKYER